MPSRAPGAEPPPLFTVGKYDVLRKLTAGGMAEIFLARVRDEVTEGRRYVVLKRMLPQLEGQPEFVDMFIDEARIAARLQHPHIVRTLDVGVEGGQHYIAMEYLHGEDLKALARAARAREGRLPIEVAVKIVADLCDALHHAHEAVGADEQPMEIVHRDVSPRNVVVSYDGSVTLLDFGIARSANRVGETKLGMLKGKIGYMSPEQCRGEPLDRRSDVFAAGILLYELVVGRRLYKAPSEFEALKLVVEGEVPPPGTFVPGLPDELQAIVMRALARSPDDRFQTAREMQLALEEFGREHKLHLSSLALARFMEATFDEQAKAWRRAQRDGLDLAEYVGAHDYPLEHANEGSIVEPSPADDERGVARLVEGGDVDRFARTPAADVERDRRGSGDGDGGASGPSGNAGHGARDGHDGGRGAESVGGDGKRPPSGRASTARVEPLGAPLALSPAALRKMLALLIVFALLAGVAAATAVLALRERLAGGPPPTGASATVAPTAFGIVVVETRPAGAALFVDGTRAGAPTPTTVDRLSLGEEHVLLVQRAGYRDVEHRFRVPATGLLRLSFDLEEVGGR